MSSVISFPSLGIGPFEINPIAISVGPLTIRWYGIIIVLGIIAGFCYAIYRGKLCGVTLDDMLDYVLVALPLGIVCARLYYVIFDSHGSYSSFYDVIAVWEGGLAIYGGIIGGFLGMLFVSRRKKNISFFRVLDCFAPGVMIGQIFGRWGNFFNAEAYGILEKFVLPFIGEIKTPAFSESFPLRMVIENSRVGQIAVHPTFLYESVWNLCGLILIHFYFTHKKYDGEITLMYFCWYGFGRFFIEGLRGDSLMLGSFRVSQLLALLLFAVSLALIIVLRNRAKKKALLLDDYVTQFDVDESDAEKARQSKGESKAKNSVKNPIENSIESPNKNENL